MTSNLPIRLILLLFMIEFVFGLQLQCYSNAHLILPPSTILYTNVTLQSCRCISITPTIFGFQYDSNNRSCYTFQNDSSQSDLRARNNSQVCFLNRTSTTTIATLPYPPITLSTSTDGNTYYQREIVYLNNNQPLTSLALYISVTRSQNPTNPSSYTNFPENALNLTITYTTDRIIFSFELIQGETVPTGSYQLAAQYNLNNKVQPTYNDTYQMQINSYQNVMGHF